jgi:polyisoprenyl-phosphate glycosyltransferase
MLKEKNILIVVPCHNEVDNILPFFNKFLKLKKSSINFKISLCFVNDGSLDGSWEIINHLAISNEDVKGINFSRNFGKELAVTAAFFEFGEYFDAVITMDCDLQHPFKIVPDLISKWSEGSDIVEAVREGNADYSYFRALASKLFHFLINKLSNLPSNSGLSDFRLYDKKLVVLFAQFPEKKRLVRGVMDWMGFKKTIINYNAPTRNAGMSSYSFNKLLSLAINSITSFSTLPLKFIILLGLIIIIFSGLLGVFVIFQLFGILNTLFTPLAMAVILILFISGVLLLSIGLLGLYIGNIYNEVLNRPLFIIKDKLNSK